MHPSFREEVVFKLGTSKIIAVQMHHKSSGMSFASSKGCTRSKMRLNALIDLLDLLVTTWHGSLDSDISLHEYMGLSESEYSAFMRCDLSPVLNWIDK